MKTKLFCLSVFLCLGLAGFAQDNSKASLEKSSRHGEWVEIKSGSRTVRCFVVYPEVKNRAAAVVVIHEIFGLTDWARNAADQVAASGCIAVAPDLLSGMGPHGGGSSDFASIDDARGAVAKLDQAQVAADLNAVANYALTLPAANGKLAVAGFCWGGGQAFRFACDRPDLKASYVFYGPPPPAADFTKIHCPVYGFYGENDARITSTLPATEEQMKSAGKTYKPVAYDGAGHGFMRTGEMGDASPANKRAHDQAWKRLRELLGKI